MIPQELPDFPHLRGEPGVEEWIAALPALLTACAKQWQLEVGAPYPGSYASVAAPAASRDGTAVVLKIQFPHRECEHEGAALRAWGGDGAIGLLDEDPGRHALLLERCTPGTHLVERGIDEALDVFIDLLPRLWKPVQEPFTSLADEARWWREDTLPRRWEATGHPFEAELFEAALEQLDVLGSSQDEHEQVLLHQDLHAQNVLAAAREPWLAIDPKPLVGERAFSVAPIVRDFDLGHDKELVARRLDRLVGELELERDRAWGWALGQTVAWAFDGEGALGRHLDTARWLLELR